MFTRILFGIMAMALVFPSAAQEMKLDVLKAGSQVYSNVTILRASATDLYFRHDGAIKNVKFKYLSPEIQKRFNYDPIAAEQLERRQDAFVPVAPPSAGNTNKTVSSADNLLDPISEASLLGKPAPKLDTIKWVGGVKPALEGRCVLVLFFTTWSIPVRSFIPQLNTLHKQSPNKLTVVGITTESESAIAGMADPKPEFPCGQDAQARLTSAAAVSSVPHVLLLDTKGVVHYSGHPAGLTERKLASLTKAEN